MAVFKGGEDGVRNSIGNMSAPWLLVSYFAGTMARGWLRGAYLGAVACFAALVSFYVTQAFVLDLGNQSLWSSLMLTLNAGRIYYLAGIVTGPLLGAIGSMRTRYNLVVTAAVVGCVLTGEPLAVFAWLAVQGMSPADSGMIIRYPALWIGEMLLGLTLGIILLLRARKDRRNRQSLQYNRW